MQTVEKECYIEFEEKRSKFIGYIKPVSSKEEAENFINNIKGKHPDATHNCSAYKVTENGQEYYKVDDDGEPGGTAGKPIGEIMNLLDVDNLVVVVTRYFGGIKLGAGGLVRNYAKAAKLAVQEAGIIEYVHLKKYLVDFSYDKVNEVEGIISSSGGKILEKEFMDKVTFRIMIKDETESLLKEVRGLVIFEI
ncbi:YigZ family protein [uncultured Ilyobacter sp.]|uniref:IMPACT family protein n=1 Tax=uncultured Ilyobacter sp. TaxID=544433 RepID=UPI002AA6845D|nr:YigZ family protein [uncultured Ilyobacter sp.]